MDPESRSAWAVKVLPPGPFSMTLLVIMRMSGRLEELDKVTALIDALESLAWFG